MRISLSFALFTFAAGWFSISSAPGALADNPYVVRRDGGGKVMTYIYYWHRVSQRYDRVVIDGPCKSACTMVLGILPLNRVCITPRGSFAFHAAHVSTDKTVKTEKATENVYSVYAAPVKEWVTAHHALDTTNFTWLKSKDVNFIAHCSAPKGFKKDRELIKIVHNSSKINW